MSFETHSSIQHLLLDPVSHEIMVDAVTLTCGHTVSQKTADVCLQKGLPCPIDQTHAVSSYVPSLMIRQLVQSAAHPIPLSPAHKSLEAIERLMSGQQLLIAELKASKAELQAFKRQYETDQIRQEMQLQLARCLTHPLVGKEELKNYFGEESQELRSLSDITQILFWPCPIWSDKATVSGLTEVMQQCSNLTTLRMSWCQSFADKDLEVMVSCFSNPDTHSSWKTSHLRHLDLSNCQRVTNGGLSIIGQNFPNLQRLILNGCTQINDGGIQILSYNMGGSSNCPYMQILGLSETQITDQALRYIARFCPDLHTLDLSHCKQITDVGVIYIAEAYRENLRNVHLEGCHQTTDASLPAIAQNCPNLKEIHWRDTQISPAAIQSLIARFPHVCSFPPPPPPLPSIAFGKAKWETYFGDVGKEPPLPPHIDEILASPCPYDPGKTVQETHMLVLVPATVNGKPLTPNSLGELIKTPRGGGHATQYRNIYPSILEKYGNISCRESHWVLMTRDVLPGTERKSFKDQCALLGGFREYRVLTLVEAITCVGTEYVVSGNRLYGDNPWTYTRCEEDIGDNPWTYTRCEEDIKEGARKAQIEVGGFSVAGLSLFIFHDDVTYGIAGGWKFVR